MNLLSRWTDLWVEQWGVVANEANMDVMDAKQRHDHAMINW